MSAEDSAGPVVSEPRPVSDELAEWWATWRSSMPADARQPAWDALDEIQKRLRERLLAEALKVEWLERARTALLGFNIEISDKQRRLIQKVDELEHRLEFYRAYPSFHKMGKQLEKAEADLQASEADKVEMQDALDAKDRLLAAYRRNHERDEASNAELRGALELVCEVGSASLAPESEPWKTALAALAREVTDG